MKLGNALSAWAMCGHDNLWDFESSCAECNVVASRIRAMGCRPPGLVDRPVGMTLGELGPFGPECVHPASLLATLVAPSAPTSETQSETPRSRPASAHRSAPE